MAAEHFFSRAGENDEQYMEAILDDRDDRHLHLRISIRCQIHPGDLGQPEYLVDADANGIASRRNQKQFCDIHQR